MNEELAKLITHMNDEITNCTQGMRKFLKPGCESCEYLWSLWRNGMDPWDEETMLEHIESHESEES